MLVSPHRVLCATWLQLHEETCISLHHWVLSLCAFCHHFTPWKSHFGMTLLWQDGWRQQTSIGMCCGRCLQMLLARRGWRWGGWSSSPLPWQWTDRQRCGLHHIWRAPHGLTDTQTRGQDPRCSHTHTHHKCLQWWSTWQSATRPAAKYIRACFDAWITLNCTADTVSLYHPLHFWQQIKTHNVLNLTHIMSFPWG